jgi:nucleoid-associated protein YgaU
MARMTTYRFTPEAGVTTSTAGGPQPSWDEVRARLLALGLPTEALRIAGDGGAVILEGSVPDPATQERIVLAVGNMRGVERVVDRMVPAQRPGLLEAFAGLAHLPPGAGSLNTAEEQVHDAQPDPGDRAFGPAGSLFHAVREGETLEGIAQRHYGMTREVRRIREANAGLLGQDEAALRPGMVLRLPEEGRRGARRGPATPSTG